MLTKRQIGRVPARGFSLIELLVVVGIIILLLSILLPALASAKKQSYVTGTTAQMQAIRSGCEAYYTTFGAYPGAFREKDIAGAAATTVTPLTGTQNLVISLMGGLSTTTGTAIAANTIGSNTGTLVSTPGSGPVDLTSGKQYAAFYTSRGEVVAANGTTGTYKALASINDRFPDSLPILYFRRSAGVSSPVVGTTNTPVAAYYMNCNYNYTGNTALQSSTGIVYNQGTYTSGSNTFTTFASTTNLANAVTVNGNTGGGFVLIAAGPDRYYGTVTASAATTSDNIVVLGGQ